MWNSVARTHKRLGGKSPTFAIMADGMGDAYQQGILAGVIEGASAAGANILCFAGGHGLTGTTLTARHEVYRLITPQVVDGVLLLSSTLVHDIGKSGLADYVRHNFASLPVCSVGVDLDSVPSITTDNQSGIRATISHLVREHGHRRIAFVRGPSANDEAEVRFRAYVAALNEQGLPFDDRLVVTGDFLAASGVEAVRKLAQVPGLPIEDLDAIAVSNDAMAFGVLEALEERGLAVPEQIAVTGFDDVEEARLAPPPLTTVRQPLERLGRQALSTLLEWVQQGRAPQGAQLNSELVLRHSCGCDIGKRNGPVAIPVEATHGFEAMLLMRRRQIIDILTRTGRGSMAAAGPDWPARLLNALIADIGKSPTGDFARVISQMVEKSVGQGTSLETFQAVISTMREQVIELVGSDRSRRNWAEDLFHTAYLVVSEASHRVVARERLKVGRWVERMSVTCNTLAATFDLAELRACMEEQLPLLGIESHFVVLWRPDLGPDQGELVAAIDRGRRSNVGIGSLFAISALLPLDYAQTITAGRSFAVMPLAWKRESYGHALMELRLDRAFAYGPIADAIATAIRGAYLTCGRVRGSMSVASPESGTVVAGPSLV